MATLPDPDEFPGIFTDALAEVAKGSSGLGDISDETVNSLVRETLLYIEDDNSELAAFITMAADDELDLSALTRDWLSQQRDTTA